MATSHSHDRIGSRPDEVAPLRATDMTPRAGVPSEVMAFVTPVRHRHDLGVRARRRVDVDDSHEVGSVYVRLDVKALT